MHPWHVGAVSTNAVKYIEAYVIPGLVGSTAGKSINCLRFSLRKASFSDAVAYNNILVHLLHRNTVRISPDKTSFRGKLAGKPE